MITANVIHRTFFIRYGDLSGTALAIDRDHRQYLVTARHVVAGIATGEVLHVYHERQWKEVTVQVVGLGAGDVDVAVLALPIQIAPPLPLEPSSAGLAFGQAVYFLGFPFGWTGDGENINRDFPIPFVKSGVMSAFIFGEDSRIYIDGHNNKGFSGGPVVFVPMGSPTNELKLAGVVSNYPVSREPVVDAQGQPILGADAAPVAYVQENPGFVVAFDVRHATDLIDANPVGLALTAE